MHFQCVTDQNLDLLSEKKLLCDTDFSIGHFSILGSAHFKGKSAVADRTLAPSYKLQECFPG